MYIDSQLKLLNKMNMTLSRYLILVFLNFEFLVVLGQEPNEKLQIKPSFNFFGFDAPKFYCFAAPQKPQVSEYIREIFEDKNGVLWFGTLSDGVCKYDGANMQFFGKKEGLAGNQVNGIAEDKYGNIWLATDGGLSKYDGKRFTSFKTSSGLSDNAIWSILIDRKGIVWVGTTVGVDRFDGKKFQKFGLPKLAKLGVPSFNEAIVWSMMEDKRGNIWFGTDGGGLKKFDGKMVYTYSQKSGLKSNDIRSVFEDHEGVVWLGTAGGGVSKFDGKTFTNFGEKEGLNNVNIWTIFEDKKHQMWFGTGGGGVNKFDGKTFKNFKETKGYTKNHVQSIWQDKRGNLWLGFSGGLYRLNGGLIENISLDKLIGC